MIYDLISQFRYKSRVYQQPNVNEKQIEKLHTQVRLIFLNKYFAVTYVD